MEENFITTRSFAAKMRFICSQGMDRPFLMADRENTGDPVKNNEAIILGSGIIAPAKGDNPIMNIDDVICIIYSSDEKRSVVIHLTMDTLTIQGHEYKINDEPITTQAQWIKIAAQFLTTHLWFYNLDD